MAIIEQILHDIEQAPSTFLNLARTGDGLVEVLGPMPLGREDTSPRYSFTDEAIAAVESGDYTQVSYGPNVDLCGNIFGGALRQGEGTLSLPLMMRLARAGVIRPTNYSEGYDLDAWSAIPEAGAEMKALVRGRDGVPSHIRSTMRVLLSPDSSVKAGRALYSRLVENYR